MRIPSCCLTAVLIAIALLAPAFAPAQEPAASNAGQTLVETPQPLPASKKAVPTHAFWDRTNILLFSGIFVMRGLDYASTQNFLARGREEILIPDDVVFNHAGFASLEGASTLTSIGLAYVAHRTGHHTIERWISIVHIGVTGFGVVRNYSLKSAHPLK